MDIKATFDVVDTAFPAGTKAVGFKLTLVPVIQGEPGELLAATTLDSQGYAMTAALAATEITIEDVEPGTYQGRIALVDSTGKEMAPGVTDPAPITIVKAQPLSFPVPTTLTLTLP